MVKKNDKVLVDVSGVDNDSFKFLRELNVETMENGFLVYLHGSKSFLRGDRPVFRPHVARSKKEVLEIIEGMLDVMKTPKDIRDVPESRSLFPFNEEEDDE